MKSAGKKLLRTTLVISGLAFVGVLAGVIPISASFIRAPIENAVRNATGLDFSVDDSIILRLGPSPSVRTGKLSLGEPSGSSLVIADFLSAKVGLFPLIAGRIHVRQLTATGIRVDYCSQLPQMAQRSGEKSATWSVVVDQADIENISVFCGMAPQGDDGNIDIRHIFAAAPEHESIRVEADGNVRGIDVDVTVTGGELNSLLNKPASFPIDVSLTSNLAQLDLTGELLAPLETPAIDGEVELHSDDLQLLLSTIGIDLPDLGALHVEGRARANSEVVDLVEIVAQLGESDISADASVNLTGERPHVELSANLQQLDLGPFLERTPAIQTTASLEEPTDIELQPVLDVLGKFDADVQLAIERVLGAPQQMGGIEGGARLAGGLVDVQTLTIEILGAEISVDGSFDSNAACPEIQLRAYTSELDLAVVNPLLTLEEDVGGHVASIGLEAGSCGKSLFAHRESLRVGAEILGGRISIGGAPLPLVINQLYTSIAFAERGRAQLIGELANEAMQATLVTGSLEAFLGQDTWPVDIDLQVAGGRLQLNGRAGVANNQFFLDAPAQFDAPQIGTLHTWTTGPADATLPLQATMQLRFNETKFEADSIAIRLGESDLGGRLIWRHAQDPDLLEITTRSAYLDLDEVIAALGSTTGELDTVIQSDTNADAPVIPAGFEMLPVDLDVKFDSVNFHNLDIQQIDVSGRLRAGFIDGASVNAILEGDVVLSGTLDLDLRSSPATGALSAAAEQIDIGRLLGNLDLADDLYLRAGEVALDLTSEGTTLRQFLLNALLRADMNDFHWIVPDAKVTSKNGTRESFELSLAEVKLLAGPEGGTTWESHGEAAGLPVEVLLSMPSLREAFGDTPELPLILVAAAADNVAIIDARIDRSVEQGFSAAVVVSGAVVERERRVLSELRSPLPDYEISSDVALAENELRLPDLTLRLGNSVVNGNISLMSGGERRRAEISLHAPHLQTDDLRYWTTNFRTAADDPDEQPTGDDQPVDEDDSSRGVLPVLSDYISEFRQSSDLDLNIIVDELHAGADRMAGAELHLYVDEDEFNLQPLRINSAAGDVDVEYTWRNDDGVNDIGLEVHADALSYGGLLRLIDNESEASGVLYLDTDISAQMDGALNVAPLEFLLKNANGNFELAAWPENADAGLLDLWTGNLILALLPSPTAEQSNVLNCLAVRLEVEDGVMQTGTALLDSTTTIIRGRGKIDLAQQQLELLVAPQAKRERFLSMSTPVMVTGPFNDFQIGVEPAGMFGTLMRWWMNLIYVPFKWLTGERYPADGTATCFDAMDWELTPELQDYFMNRKAGGKPN